MSEAARLVTGEHDFTSFAASDPDRSRRMEEAVNGDGPSNVRTIFCSQLERQGDELIYTVRGNGFLHHMVRNLIGTFLLVGKGSMAPGNIPGILSAQNRSANPGATAPASGLYLVSVEYI
jgi:tRNA pseudouridine38-40 synthase